MKDPVLITATKHAVTVGEDICLHEHLRDLLVRVWFGDVNKKAVTIFLGSSYIDKFVRRTFPQELRIFPIHSTPVAIGEESSESMKKATETVESQAKPDTRRIVVQVATVTVITARTQQRVLVRTRDSGLRPIQPQLEKS